jgi:hypothetical protein
MLDCVELEIGEKTHYKINGVWCTEMLIRLQRWVRNKIRINRRLAIAMSSHHRLGLASRLGWLDQELILLVLSKC